MAVNNCKEMEINCPTINMLNDDCLLHIFNFLYNPRDLITIEKVCRRWKAVVSSQMAWKKVVIQGPDFNKNLEEILQKCGDRVINLRVEYQKKFQWENSLDIISMHCKKLLHLDICFPSRLNDFIKLEELQFIKNLKCLLIRNLRVCFFDFLYLAEYIENITLYDTHIASLCIKRNGKKIKLTNFYSHHTMYPETYLSSKLITARLPTLVQLKFHYKQYYFDEDLFLFHGFCHVANLITAFNFTSTHNCFKGIDFQTIKFNNVKKLVIIFSDVDDDDFLVFIKTCPRLEEIYLDKNSDLTHFGFRHLGNLKNLIKLSFGFTAVSVSTIEYLAQCCNNLQEIYCPSLVGSLASDFEKIVDYLPDLKLIRLSTFDDLTERNLQSILQKVQQRNNNTYLNMEILNGTPDDVERLNLTNKKKLEPQDGLIITLLGLHTDKDREDFEKWKLCVEDSRNKLSRRRLNSRWCLYYTLIDIK